VRNRCLPRTTVNATPILTEGSEASRVPRIRLGRRWHWSSDGQRCRCGAQWGGSRPWNSDSIEDELTGATSGHWPTPAGRRTVRRPKTMRTRTAMHSAASSRSFTTGSSRTTACPDGSTWSSRGSSFETETDTEVLAKLVGHFLRRNRSRRPSGGRCAEVRGTFGIAVTHADEPNLEVVAARRGSPLIVGVGRRRVRGRVGCGSAIVKHTPQAIYLVRQRESRS
jgi:hypothetical protein